MFRLLPNAGSVLLTPGVAMTIVRHCLEGLASLHRQRVVHGDIKPSNLMVRTTGTTKIIDYGSACKISSSPAQRAFTPAYAAPETLERFECTPQSDLASLGYVLVEMLSGQRLFAGLSRPELLEARRRLPERLPQLLPKDFACSKMLVDFCRRLVAWDPAQRFVSAERADLDPECGASAFLFSLVRGNLGCVFEKAVAQWVEAVMKWTDIAPVEDLLDKSLVTDSTWTKS